MGSRNHPWPRRYRCSGLVETHRKAIGPSAETLKGRVVDVFIEVLHRSIAHQEVCTTRMTLAEAPTVVPVILVKALGVRLTCRCRRLKASKAGRVGIDRHHRRGVCIVQSIKTPVAVEIVMALCERFTHKNRF